MPLMMFNAPVKYKGVRYEARQHFQVDQVDVSELRKDGGWLLEQPSPANPPKSNPVETGSSGENNGEGTKQPTEEKLKARLDEIDKTLDDLHKTRDEYSTKKPDLEAKVKDLTEKSSKAKGDAKKALKAELKQVKKTLDGLNKEIAEADEEIAKLDAEAEKVEQLLDSLVQGDE